MTRAIFLDRDGVLNELVYYADYGEYESPRYEADLRLLNGIFPALRQLQTDGWQLFLISNQPSYAKGKIPLENLHQVHAALQQQLEAEAIFFTEFYYSYTHPRGVVAEYTGESVYRKPNPGFIWAAQQQYQLDLSQCWMVGDRDVDLQCGQRAGCQTALVLYPLSNHQRGTTMPDWTGQNLPEFVTYVSKDRSHAE